MIRLRHSSVLLCSVVVVALLMAMSYVIVSGNGKPSAYDLIAEEQFGSDASVASETEFGVDRNTELLSRVGDSRTVASAGFTLEIPEGWIVEGSDDEERSADGRMTYGWLYGGTSAKIRVQDVEKDGASFDEVLVAHEWNDADAEKIVAFMREEAAETFPDFSAEDILVGTTYDQIGTALAARSMLQCLEPCYVQDGAATNVTYFIDAPDRVYLLTVSTGIQADAAADVLNAADAVVRTFQVR